MCLPIFYLEVHLTKLSCEQQVIGVGPSPTPGTKPHPLDAPETLITTQQPITQYHYL